MKNNHMLMNSIINFLIRSSCIFAVDFIGEIYNQLQGGQFLIRFLIYNLYQDYQYIND